jgi:hypothetical protein
MPNLWEAGKHKVLNVWRRAPTLLTVVGIVLLLICSMSCLCGGCLSSFFRGSGPPPAAGDKSGKPAAGAKSGKPTDEPRADRPAGKGTGMSIELFTKQTVDGKYRKGEFFDRFGQPSRIETRGDYVYLHYHCTDGTVRLKCPKTFFEFDNLVSPVAAERD